MPVPIKVSFFTVCHPVFQICSHCAPCIGASHIGSVDGEDEGFGSKVSP